MVPITRYHVYSAYVSLSLSHASIRPFFSFQPSPGATPSSSPVDPGPPRAP